MKKLVFLSLIFLMACQSGDSAKEAWEGRWSAKWSTDPSGYGDLALGMSFEMDGVFEFDEEQVTIDAYGFEGCIFGEDTLSHSQSWEIRNDTLELQHTPGEPGIFYKVLEQTDQTIRLQLVDDIFVTLTKP